MAKLCLMPLSIVTHSQRCTKPDSTSLTAHSGSQENPQQQDIMLVDRNAVTRLGLRVFFGGEQRLRIVAETGSANEAAQLFQKHHPQIVILDTCLADGDGLELARDFALSDSRVLIFTHQNSREDVYRAFTAHAHGFVAKSSSPQELLRAIHLLIEDRVCFPAGHQHLFRERTCQTPLSSREVDALRLASKGHSNKEIAAKLGVSDATAKTFLVRAMKKLDVHDRTQAVLAALERGWISRNA